ncbi:phage tail tip lysozyme [Methylobacterium sp. J-026]|uniref:phage tail tip lysozyme n=1 Tax=Methylobacterium sp. J-026 TaxID=2836624 RepID=UPI001FBA051E|nr:phage tail tip lysozyme [Methylobacterium sp. J-026]MCJ2133347.1 phage tail tip lysozyme [Methylobacterium sp. J-026]
MKETGVDVEDLKTMQDVVAKVGRGNRSVKAALDELLLPMTNRQLNKEVSNIGKVGDDAAAVLSGNDPKLARDAFWKQLENLEQALGGPLVKPATDMLKEITAAVSQYAQLAAQHPDAVLALGKGFVAVGAALTGGGAIALFAALGPVGWLAAGLIGAGAAFVAFKTPMENWIRSGTGMGPQLDAMDKGFNKLAVSFGKWASPELAAADTAFNKAALAFGEWVKSVIPSADTVKGIATTLATEIASWPSRLGAAISEMGTGLVTAIGEMLKGLFGKLNPFSKTGFEGDGFDGSMIHNASFVTGGANDNFGGASGVARALGRGGFRGAGGGTALSSIGSGGDYHAVVGGRSYRAAYAAGGRERVGSWLDMLQRPVDQGGLGMEPDKARAMVAMMQGESGINLNPGAIGDHGTSLGTAQWHGARARQLLALAQQMGLPWRDVRVQQQMFRDEMLGRYRHSVYDPVMGAQSGDHAFGIGIDHFESPVKKELAYRFRHPYLDALRHGADHPVAQQPPTAPAPPKRPQEIQLRADLHMDGQKVARSVTKHQVAMARFPTSVGGTDRYGNWHGPATAGTKVA